MTNFERIKGMSQEELAKLLSKGLIHLDCWDCPVLDKCKRIYDAGTCEEFCFEWLNREVE